MVLVFSILSSDSVFLLAESTCKAYSFLFLSDGRPYQQISMTANRAMATGCSTNVPTAWARIPVVKGAAAPPEDPNAEMTPRPVIC